MESCFAYEVEHQGESLTLTCYVHAKDMGMLPVVEVEGFDGEEGFYRAAMLLRGRYPAGTWEALRSALITEADTCRRKRVADLRDQCARKLSPDDAAFLEDLIDRCESQPRRSRGRPSMSRLERAVRDSELVDRLKDFRRQGGLSVDAAITKLTNALRREQAPEASETAVKKARARVNKYLNGGS